MVRKTKRNVEVVSIPYQLPVGSSLPYPLGRNKKKQRKMLVPRALHSRILRKPSIPTRHFAVLDAAGRERREEYRPGTRWCTECSTQVDKEVQFTSHPES